MFRFETKSSVAAGLRAYLAESTWHHAVHVMPLLAAMEAADQSASWPPRSFDSGLFDHITWTLDAWSALRSRGRLAEKMQALARELPPFSRHIGRLIARPGVTSLSCLPDTQVLALADELGAYFWEIGPKLKPEAGKSCVLPSKLGHLLYPGMIPAYDRKVIRDGVLKTVLVDVKEPTYYATYFRLSWWILRQLSRHRQLENARRRVAGHLRQDWSIKTLQPVRPQMSSLSLARLDTYVSEYALIGLAKEGARITSA